MTGVTAMAGMAGPTSLMDATAPLAFTAVGSVADPAAGPPGAGAWIAAVLVALATAVLLLPARRGLPRGWTADTSPTGASDYEIGRRRVGKECRSRWSPYH